MPESPWDLTTTVAQIGRFNRARGWGSFHNPKNLVMALASEVGELAAEFQWLDFDESTEVMQSTNASAVEDEMADVAIYLLTLADRLGIDLRTAIEAKLERNQTRFPALGPGETEGAP